MLANMYALIECVISKKVVDEITVVGLFIQAFTMVMHAAEAMAPMVIGSPMSQCLALETFPAETRY